MEQDCALIASGFLVLKEKVLARPGGGRCLSKRCFQAWRMWERVEEEAKFEKIANLGAGGGGNFLCSGLYLEWVRDLN